MKQHEREYFVSRIRSGFYIVPYNDINIKILTPTAEQEFYNNQVFQTCYDQCIEDGIKSMDEMHEWMKNRGLWSDEDDAKIEGLEKDIKRLKKEIYLNRYKSDLKDQIRKYLRAGERQLAEKRNSQYCFFETTAEGLAGMEKVRHTLKNNAYLGNELFDFANVDPDYIWSKYTKLLLNETQVRDLARNEPWRGCWMFASSNDALLDGWFLVQQDKREKERKEAEVNDTLTNSKIASSPEVFMMAGSNKDISSINDMNSTNSKMVRKERDHVIKSQGVAKDSQFRDRKLEIQQQSNEQFKNKFRR